MSSSMCFQLCSWGTLWNDFWSLPSNNIIILYLFSLMLEGWQYNAWWCFKCVSKNKCALMLSSFFSTHILSFASIIYIQLVLSWEKRPLLFKCSWNIFHFISLLPHVARYIFKFLTKLSNQSSSHSNISFSNFTRNFQW